MKERACFSMIGMLPNHGFISLQKTYFFLVKSYLIANYNNPTLITLNSQSGNLLAHKSGETQLHAASAQLDEGV